MYVLDGMTLAIHQIRSQKLKSFFSVLGVVLGVTFLITVVTIVQGMDTYVREEVASQVLGVNTVTISRQPQNDLLTDDDDIRREARNPVLRMADADDIRQKLEIPMSLAVESQTSAEAFGDTGRRATGVWVTVASSTIFGIRGLEIARGRPFGPQEENAAVVVLGSETAEVLFEGLDPLGRTVRLAGAPHRVIGVLEARGSLLGTSLDNLAVAPPLSPIQAATNAPGVIDRILVQTDDPSRLREAQLEIEGILRVRRSLRPHEPNNFGVETADDAMAFWDTISRILFTALPGLVAISLVVGGIVIMNIMLVSVMERTREIGTRKAVGARRKDVLTQVLIESATLSTFGAAIGVGLGIGLASLLETLSPLPAAVSPVWITVGLMLGLLVGISAGVYPASRAAGLNPVDALRHE